MRIHARARDDSIEAQIADVDLLREASEAPAVGEYDHYRVEAIDAETGEWELIGIEDDREAANDLADRNDATVFPREK